MNITWYQTVASFLGTKDGSEIVKNYAEVFGGLGAVIGGLLELSKWRTARNDRAAEVLFKIEDKFVLEAVKEGKKLIEVDKTYAEKKEVIDRAVVYGKSRGDDLAGLDALLRFYVILYGILLANQVPKDSLSICFRYWLAHYYRTDRKEFHDFVDYFYPTLRKWLDKECPFPKNPAKWSEGFFRPDELFSGKVIGEKAKRGENQSEHEAAKTRAEARLIGQTLD